MSQEHRQPLTQPLLFRVENPWTHKGNVHPQSKPTCLQWLHLFKAQSCAETRGLSAFRSAWQTSGSCPWPCRGGTWLEPAQLSHTFVCLRVQHIPHTHKAGHVTQIPVVTTNGDSWGDKAPGPKATYAIHPLQMSDKLILWGKIKARQSPILITLPLLVRTKRVLLAAMKYWPLKNWFPFHKNL